MFKPGQSGNPKGRPRGSFNATKAFFNQSADEVRRRVVEAALSGDVVACKFVLERVIAPQRDNPVEFPIPKITCIDDARKAISMIIDGQSDGTLTGDEAHGLIRNIQQYIQIVEVADIEARLKKIEEDRV